MCVTLRKVHHSNAGNLEMLATSLCEPAAYEYEEPKKAINSRSTTNDSCGYFQKAVQVLASGSIRSFEPSARHFAPSTRTNLVFWIEAGISTLFGARTGSIATFNFQPRLPLMGARSSVTRPNRVGVLCNL